MKQKLSTKKKQEIATRMGHDLFMQDLYRREEDFDLNNK
jgi:hypothetical protein